MTERGERRDSALIEVALDAARVTDDFVRGVIDNRDGRAGGSEHVKRGKLAGFFGAARALGEQQLVKSMAVQYGPDQLRKAGAAAEELVEAVSALADAWTPAATDATARLAALRLDELPWVLRDGDVGVARDVHDRLTRAISILNEARTGAVLFEMRQAREQGEHPSG